MDTIDDIAVLTISSMDLELFIIVDKDDNILFEVNRDVNHLTYCSSRNALCEDYKINNNKIVFYAHALSQNDYHLCNSDISNDEEVIIKYELTYENDKLSEPKKLSSITKKDYINKGKLNCSN